MKALIFMFGLIVLISKCQSEKINKISFTDTTFPPVVKGQFPWQVFIYNKDNDKVLGGGSILSDSWILTTSKICYDNKDLRIEFGAITYNDSDSISMVASDFHLHPKYERKIGSFNNVCLVKLPHTLEFSDNIKPIKLLPYERLYDTYKGIECLICGLGFYGMSWGKVKILDRQECHGSIFRGLLVDQAFCVKGEGISVDLYCNCEDGAPLVMKDADGEWMQIGIKAVGRAHYCWTNNAIIYQDLWPFLEFINETMVVKN